MERVKGIEPSSQAWEARILPLNHTRFHKADSYQIPWLGASGLSSVFREGRLASLSNADPSPSILLCPRRNPKLCGPALGSRPGITFPEGAVSALLERYPGKMLCEATRLAVRAAPKATVEPRAEITFRGWLSRLRHRRYGPRHSQPAGYRHLLWRGQ